LMVADDLQAGGLVRPTPRPDLDFPPSPPGALHALPALLVIVQHWDCLGINNVIFTAGGSIFF